MEHSPAGAPIDREFDNPLSELLSMGRVKQQTFRLCSSVLLVMVTSCATEQMMMDEAGDSATQVLAQSTH